jgi:hypothetical protein
MVRVCCYCVEQATAAREAGSELLKDLLDRYCTVTLTETVTVTATPELTHHVHYIHQCALNGVSLHMPQRS